MIKKKLIRVYETLSTGNLKEIIKGDYAYLGDESLLIKAELLRRNIPENELPSDSEMKSKTFLTNLKGISVLALLLTLFGFLIFVCIYDFEPEQKSDSLFSKPNGYTAYYQSQYYVRQRLKSSSSAKFPNPVNNRELLGVDLGEGRFEVSAYVDAKNSFGAITRSRYTCILKGIETVDGNRWILESIEFD